MMSGTTITFFGGINEIGGNKFLVEDRGTKIFIDFGMQIEKNNQYFSNFFQPRTCNGMGDLFEFGLLPKLRGLYRLDYARHTNFGDEREASSFDAVLLSHAHLDHAAYLHYLRPDIPIFCTEETKLILRALQETGNIYQYVTYKENFAVYKNRSGQLSRSMDDEHREIVARDIRTVQDSKPFKIDSVEVEPISIDHSLPGSMGYILHASSGSIAYTADIRFHGRRAGDTQRFVSRCSNSCPDILLCEGTRIDQIHSKTEFDVESEVTQVVKATPELVVCNYPWRDLDRFLSFYKAAVASGRDLVINTKQAYLLWLFRRSNGCRELYPSEDDRHIKIFLAKKSWGLIDKDQGEWPRRLLEQDYDAWERMFLDYPNGIDWRDVSSHQKDFIFYCNDYELQNLIDILPNNGSSYIRSSTEPFNEEMELEEQRVRRWLIHFGLITRENDWHQIHVSGHGDGGQIRQIVNESHAKEVVPVHTEHPEYFQKWHDRIKIAELNGAVGL
jgi:ribonuclease J